jgi:AraC-like DNA-binding protein
VQLITFNTNDVSAQQRIECWNDMCSAATTPLVADPLDKQNFSARLCVADLGRLKISEIRSTAAIVRHSKQHVAISREPQFLIGLQLRGAHRFRQLGRETLIRQGDFALFDSTLPFDVLTAGPHWLLVLGFPHDMLRRSISCPEAVLGVPMRGDAELSGLVSRFIRSFWSDYRDRLDAAPLPRITMAILDLLGSAYSLPDARLESSPNSAVWRVRIKEHIEAHLDNADLTPAQVASTLRISTRYLHYLFDQGDQTVARHIQNRRLEKCAEDLTDPAQRGRTVTEIALNHGFNNASHFSRIFRARYKTSAREYRTAATHVRAKKTDQ